MTQKSNFMVYKRAKESARKTGKNMYVLNMATQYAIVFSGLFL